MTEYKPLQDDDLDEYMLAPSGEGDRAYDWDDKPHRLVYDLVRMLREERAKKAVSGEPMADIPEWIEKWEDDSMDEIAAKIRSCTSDQDAYAVLDHYTRSMRKKVYRMTGAERTKAWVNPDEIREEAGKLFRKVEALIEQNRTLTHISIERQQENAQLAVERDRLKKRTLQLEEATAKDLAANKIKLGPSK